MISRYPTFLSALVVVLLVIISCSGGDSGSGTAIVLDTQEPSGYNLLQENEPNHYLWSYHLIYINPEENEVEIIPVRQVADHWNVLSWLEQWPCNDCLKLTNLTQLPTGTLLADIQISHPFQTPNLTGFDVRGVAIFDASKTFPVSGLTFSDRMLGDTQLVNADAYTTLYNGSTEGFGPGGLQGYFKGKMAAPQAPNGLLNGYRRFISSGPSNMRNAFYANDLVTVTYEIVKTPGPIVLGYAVDACWVKADVIPVNDPMADFPPDANCPEPWEIVVSGDPIVEDGETVLTIDVYDWQGSDTHHEPVIECPELFNDVLTGSLVFDFGNFSRWEVAVQNENSASQGNYLCLISVEAIENDPIGTPWLNLKGYQVIEIEVVTQGEGWARTWGGPGIDEGIDIAVDSGGNVYVSGIFSESVDFDPGPAYKIKISFGELDVFLSKFDPNGNLLWVNTWGGVEDDAGYGLDVDSLGNVYVAGYYQVDVDFDPDPDGQDNHNAGMGHSSFISKFNADGDFIWVHTWDVMGHDVTRDLDVGPFDGVYIVGFERIETGQFNTYLRKINASGALEFHQSWGGINYFVPLEDEYSVAVDTFGNVFVTGLFDQTKDFDPGPDVDLHSSNGSFDVFLSKFTADGTYLWSITWGGDSPQYECGTGVGIDAGGNVYV